jgi:hypothetical protein
MKLTDCTNIIETIVWLGEQDMTPNEEVRNALYHIAKLEYQRGLLRGAQLGIEAAATMKVPFPRTITNPMDQEMFESGLRVKSEAIRTINPADVITKEVK